MAHKTPIPRGEEVVRFSMRNLRLDYLDRLRICAFQMRTTVEDCVNQVIGHGIERLETQAAKARKRQRQHAD